MNMDYYKKYEPIFSSWYIKKRLGEGSYGKVFLIEKKDFITTYQAALKVITIPKSKSEVKELYASGMDRAGAIVYFRRLTEEIAREYILMSKLKGNSNIVSYEDHTIIEHEDGLGRDILIRMELLTPLFDYINKNKITRRDIIKLGIDICKALELCQKYNIVHRDIKPQNIFVSENGDFKLGDFGIARTFEGSKGELSTKGTNLYIAPEIVRGEAYGTSVDIYSLGIVMYRLLNENRAPFLPLFPLPISHEDDEIAFKKRISGAVLPKPKYADGRLAEIVLKACAYDPKYRYSSPMQMREELEAILYNKEEAMFIYPKGDEVPIKYVRNKKNVKIIKEADKIILILDEKEYDKYINTVIGKGTSSEYTEFTDYNDDGNDDGNDNGNITYIKKTKKYKSKRKSGEIKKRLNNKVFKFLSIGLGSIAICLVAFLFIKNIINRISDENNYVWDENSRMAISLDDTKLFYKSDVFVSNYAGTGERRLHDSNNLNTICFISPESIDVADDGTIYLTDSGNLRRIKDGKSETIEIYPEYISIRLVRNFKNQVFALTDEFKDENGNMLYGIVKISNNEAEFIFVTEAVYSKITDFDFSSSGNMFILQNNLGLGENYLCELDFSTNDLKILHKLDNGVSTLSVDRNDNIYLANSKLGTIYHYKVTENNIKLFAGKENENKFIDGPEPRFFDPSRIKYNNNFLYVMDFNMLRRIAINNVDIAIYSETLAGKITPDINADAVIGKGSETVFTSSYNLDFIILDDEVIMTDPKNGFLRKIK